MEQTPSLLTVTQLTLALAFVILASLPGSFLTRLGTKAHTATYLAIALGAGAITAQVFFHILPEISAEVIPDHGILVALALAVLSFTALFLGEKALHNYSHGAHNHADCDEDELDTQGVEAWPLLIPSALHNIFDGTLIGISFATDPVLGWGAASSVFLHELALKTSIFSLLFERGVVAGKALRGVLIASLTIVAGAIAGLLLGEAAGEVWWSIPLIAGAYMFLLRSMLVTLSHRRKGQPIWRTLTVSIIGFSLLAFLFIELAAH
jgi:zinc transporter ZupT